MINPKEVNQLVLQYLAGNLTCKEVADLVTDYLEGRLTFMERVRFQMHLGLCLDCRAYLRQMKQTIRTLGKLPAEPIPPEVEEELLRRFRNWMRR
jgi:predicted anti-sigma-YlaC factor YlaD